MTRLAAAAWLFLLAGCAAAPPAPADLPWRDSPDAVVRLHRGGVPHTDRLGLTRHSLDPARSLLPLVLDNAMVDYQRGLRFGFAAAANAGFNAVAPWAEQPRDAVLEAAAGARLLAVMPARKADAEDSDDAADNSAWFDPAGIRLARALPFRDPGPADLRPASTAAAEAGLRALRQMLAEQAGQTRPLPVWAMLQVFGTLDNTAAPDERRRLPSPAEARALAYGALAEGASGLVWFAEDSYAGRSSGAIGIAPVPVLDYGIQVFDGHRRDDMKATPGAIAAAAGLWQAVARLNREIDRLAPALLSPTAAFDYQVRLLALEPGAASLLATAEADASAPLRLLLKSFDGRFTLLAVNLTPQRWRLAVSLPQPMRRIERWFDTDAPPALLAGGSGFEEDFPPHAVRIYRLTP
ncbi:hypothetical protein [Ferrovibrio sp.]|uniref:hypothetical protein n=1 Tax=Ferrovibrio sp. TaxID=1917215 RepID=UPI001B5007E2|nr:hypothetical protein [Ferrovibrio sp.]MBP7062916.1 hypothetical protein [Ferrovibrio sp.]